MRRMGKVSIILALLFMVSLPVSPDRDLKICIPCFSKKPTGVKFPNNVYIMIDPGHGAPPVKKGESGGTSSRDYENDPPQSDVQDKPEIAERDVVLEVARKMKTTLNFMGIKNVKLTRDANVSQDRADKAKKIIDFISECPAA
jgi:N-acetylmuramoyl-L-alanine amidase